MVILDFGFKKRIMIKATYLRELQHIPVSHTAGIPKPHPQKGLEFPNINCWLGGSGVCSKGMLENHRISGSSTDIHQQRSTFEGVFFASFRRVVFGAVLGICQCDARKMQALGFSEKICGLAFPYKVGPYDRYKWSYSPYKCPYKWVTGVTTPINGVITITLITYNWYGAHLVYIQSYILYKVFTVSDRYVFGGPNTKPQKVALDV